MATSKFSTPIKSFMYYVDAKGVYQGPSTLEGEITLHPNNNVVSLGTLKVCKGSLDIEDCKGLEAPHLEEVRGALDVSNCDMAELPKLREVGSSLFITGSTKISFPKLTQVGMGIRVFDTAGVPIFPALNTTSGQPVFIRVLNQKITYEYGSLLETVRETSIEDLIPLRATSPHLELMIDAKLKGLL